MNGIWWCLVCLLLLLQADMMGLAVSNFVHRADHDMIQKKLDDYMASGTPAPSIGHFINYYYFLSFFFFFFYFFKLTNDDNMNRYWLVLKILLNWSDVFLMSNCVHVGSVNGPFLNNSFSSSNCPTSVFVSCYLTYLVSFCLFFMD